MRKKKRKGYKGEPCQKLAGLGLNFVILMGISAEFGRSKIPVIPLLFREFHEILWEFRISLVVVVVVVFFFVGGGWCGRGCGCLSR